MKKMKTVLMAAALLAAAGASWAAEPPKMKMTTEIPEGITTPDEIITGSVK